MSTIPFGLAVSMVKSTLQTPGKFEGTTVFSAPSTHIYRYALYFDNGKLRITLEDSDSKKQWCTKELDLEDFVDASNSILDARPTDYVECFHELLSSSLEGVKTPPRALRKVKNDHLLLEFYVKVKALLKSRVVTYTFTLEPVSVERIDVLEAKLSDLQQEVKLLRAEAAGRSSAQEMQKMISDLRAEVKALRGSVNAPGAFLARATSQRGAEGLLLWRCEDLKVVDGAVHDLNPGIYQVNITGGKLRIWLENCESKKQWCTNDVVFVDYANYTPDVGAVGYIDYRRHRRASNVPAEHKGESFATGIRGQNSSPRVFMHAFNLEPISVERVDILEAKLRDLQDEVKGLRSGAAVNTVVAELQEAVKKLQRDLSEREVVTSN
ncbi:hypothetical protein PHYSODRAFT_341537 [Phytophthora sojae]|uniref:Uncharacterized protein n=1 Tax=Phytophthora sojae (strain P6497) TaxID=1094619 RepID=G5ADK2_PHYSP|nr:hypothetical protein PHYSODRAFT_341537 [Phytophthora sojae]EGZ06255.1 hypothetical protein PHYSODRAFT_341537 [Phytophthora sojae]|eukprot:XP_009538152.1 hypothetical protein PHYSODRAFT_341537 [Phytophthora sojae]